MSELKPCKRDLFEAMTELEDMAYHSSKKKSISGKTLAIAISAIQESANRRAQPANEPKECPAMERVEGGIPYCSDKQTACDGCKHANEPLTLEELRKYPHGDPVYIVDNERPEDTGWTIWTADLPDGAPDTISYGTAWLAYRRKPEEGTNV